MVSFSNTLVLKSFWSVTFIYLNIKCFSQHQVNFHLTHKKKIDIGTKSMICRITWLSTSLIKFIINKYYIRINLCILIHGTRWWSVWLWLRRLLNNTSISFSTFCYVVCSCSFLVSVWGTEILLKNLLMVMDFLVFMRFVITFSLKQI